MANQDASENKRIINITMNIELKNGESGKEYQELVKNITKDAIDAALTATKSIDNADNKEMARVRRSLDYKKFTINKNENTNAAFDTSENVNSGTKNETPKKERKAINIETDKGAETEVMKRVRLSLELKNSKKIKNSNSSATSSASLLCSPSISGTCEKKVTDAKTVKHSKKGTIITIEDKDKPIIETEAMKRIRLSLELKNKSKLNKNNNGAPTTKSTTSYTSPTSSTRPCQNVEGTGNTKSSGKGIKRKVADVGIDKKHLNTEGMKKIKLRNSRQNENYPNTPTSEINNEKMDIDDENVADYRKMQASPATSRGSKKITTQEPKNVSEKVAVETEAMKMIRLRLEVKKNKNNNENTATSTITSANSSTGTPTCATIDKQQIKSPKPVKRKTPTVDKPTEEMKRMKALIEQKNKSSKTSNPATPRNTNTKTRINHENKSYVTVPKSNLTATEMTEDESDENPAVSKTNEVNSEFTNDVNDKNKHESASRSSSMSSYQSAMSVDVEQPDDTRNIAATSTGRVTRSKTWERRVWKK